MNDFTIKVRKWAEPITEIRAVLLFGSRARGDHHQNSDWDICILLETTNSKSGNWYGTWIGLADDWHQSFCDAVGLDIKDVQFVAPTSSIVIDSIAHSCKVLYLNDAITKI